MTRIIITATYYACDLDGNNCNSSEKYEYDLNGNKTITYRCDKNGNNCSWSEKYEYDGNGNQTAYYADCDGSGNNCDWYETYENTYIDR